MARRYADNPDFTADPVRLAHPAWSAMVPKLRAAMDAHGLAHIAIWLYAQPGDPHATFEPRDPAWRAYRVEGGPHDDHIGEAMLEDLYATPVIARNGGAWEWFTGSAYGLTKMNALVDDDALIRDVLDRLESLYLNAVYVYRP